MVHAHHSIVQLNDVLWAMNAVLVGGAFERRGLSLVETASHEGRTYANRSIAVLTPDLQPYLVGRVLTRQSSESGVLRKS